jgi:disulfide bond formation protein DsbB
MDMKKHILFILSVAFAVIVVVFIFEYGYHLAPCRLCWWQRYPYIAIVFFAIIALIFQKFQKFNFIFSAIAFFITSGIAIFHSGVERHWWKGFQECSGFTSQSMSLEDLKIAILNAPIAKCDEIAWSFLGLSMANYNVLLGLIMGIYCVILTKIYSNKY